MDIATQAFLDHGYEGTSLDLIVARAGGSKSTIYAAFGSKAGLFEAIVQDLMARVVASTTGEWQVADPEAALTQLATGYLSAMAHPGNVGVWRLMVAEAERVPQIARRFYLNGPGRLASDLAAYLAACDADGRLVVGAPEMSAALFLGALRTDDVLLGRMLGVAGAPSPARRAETVAAAVSMFMAGHRPR